MANIMEPRDPDHEYAHRVSDRSLSRYIYEPWDYGVVASCGKEWKPEITDRSKAEDYPKCPTCFPPGFKNAVVA